MSKDYYSILGVSKTASPEEIKKAFRQKAHQYHPDKKGGDEEKFKEINEAYQVLGNAEKRKQYDQFGQTFEQAKQQGGFSGFNGFRDFSNYTQGFNINMDDLGDIFNSFGFGDIFGGSRRRRGGAARGHDIQTTMTVDLADVVFGSEKEIVLTRPVRCPHCGGSGNEPGAKIEPCPTCGGSGQIKQVQRTILGSIQTVRTCPDCHGRGQRASQKCTQCGGQGRIQQKEHLKIKVPAGIEDGGTIRLAGRGEAGLKGGPAGDLYITFQIRSNKQFSRQGDDLTTTVRIPFSTAVLGGKVKVQTMDGEVNLKIPAGTESGQVFKIRNKGISHLRRRGRGDLLVTVQIITPTNLSRKQRMLIEEMENEGI